MEFTLHYRGPLKPVTKSNNRRDHKHEIRAHFHKQLKELWALPQLAEISAEIRSSLEFDPLKSAGSSMLVKRGAFWFTPLVSQPLSQVASIEMTMLRPEPEGRIFKSGDIDNRLKTLLDALKVPNDKNALPTGLSPSGDESPFFCLLEDDSLISNIDVKTAHWLEPEVQDSDEVVLVLRVRTKATRITIGNIALL